MTGWLKNIYRRLPLIRELREIRQLISENHRAVWVGNFIQLDRFFADELARNPKYSDPRKLNHHETQVFSQNGEDGIIAEIFRRIGVRSRTFVESGVGDGLENNTTYLLSQGWKGAWIEGDPDLSKKIRSHFRKPLASGELKLLNSLVTAENIEAILAKLDVPKEFDLFSLDIDRNTFHVWKAIRQFQPRVVVVEYNATFPPELEWTTPYNPAAAWNQSSYFGASLKAYEQLGDTLGYALVGCDFSGTNAFFVRKTEPLELFADPFTAKNHFEPPRYWSVRREAHPRCFDDATSG